MSDQHCEARSHGTLDACTLGNTKLFSFAGTVVTAKCLSVYDGDTITVAFNVYGVYYKFHIRMLGYDTPEMKPSKASVTYDMEKKRAVEARDYLADLICGKKIRLECGDYDKYGRILGTVYLDNENINEHMVEVGHGRPYEGGTKEVWSDTSVRVMH